MVIDKLRGEERLWDLFTRREEYGSHRLDRHRRFLHSFSIHQNPLDPEVSDLLRKSGFEVTYPEGEKFALCLTHDIDTLYLPKRRLARKALEGFVGLQASYSLKMLRGLAGRRFTPLWNIPQIMEMEERYDAKSTFFFMAQEPPNPRYKVDELGLAAIVDRGWEVGLHGGYDTYNNLERMRNEKERLERALGQRVIGYRNHFLRFEVPTTWELLNQAGFEYDSTFGYPDAVGFRNGMCHPFRPFNLRTNRCIDILEIPLAIMDTTLFSHLGMDVGEAWKLILRVLRVVEEREGAIAVLWHNTSMFGEKLKLYEKMLRYCRERGAWMTSCYELWRWWERNNLASWEERS